MKTDYPLLPVEHWKCWEYIATLTQTTSTGTITITITPNTRFLIWRLRFGADDYGAGRSININVVSPSDVQIMSLYSQSVDNVSIIFPANAATGGFTVWEGTNRAFDQWDRLVVNQCYLQITAAALLATETFKFATYLLVPDDAPVIVIETSAGTIPATGVTNRLLIG